MPQIRSIWYKAPSRKLKIKRYRAKVRYLFKFVNYSEELHIAIAFFGKIVYNK